MTFFKQHICVNTRCIGIIYRFLKVQDVFYDSKLLPVNSAVPLKSRQVYVYSKIQKKDFQILCHILYKGFRGLNQMVPDVAQALWEAK